jgi:hypothetical protein
LDSHAYTFLLAAYKLASLGSHVSLVVVIA